MSANNALFPHMVLQYSNAGAAMCQRDASINIDKRDLLTRLTLTSGFQGDPISIVILFCNPIRD